MSPKVVLRRTSNGIKKTHKIKKKKTNLMYFYDR